MVLGLIRANSSLAPQCRQLSTVPFSRPHHSKYMAQYQSYARLYFRRNASTEANVAPVVEAITSSKPPMRKSKGMLWIPLLILGAGCSYVYMTDTRAGAHRWIVPSVIRWLYPDAEDAHHVGVDWLKTLYKFGLHPRERGNPDGDGQLVTQIFGHTLCNPIGISGGLDKDAEIPSQLFELGPAIVEVGGTTPLPQDGNPRPRVFRIPSQNALINRYGLNSKGADQMALRLQQRVLDFAISEGYGGGDAAEQKILNGEAGVPPGSLVEGKLLAVQVAKNKTTPDGDIEAIKRDYVYCVDRLAKYADILVVNVSSPNTPGLRDLQRVEPLTKILTGVVEAAKRIDRKTKPAVMVKVSPDENSDEQVSGICDAVFKAGVDGIIVGNTTNRRPDALPKGFAMPVREQNTMSETGGFSGPQLFDGIVPLVAKYRNELDRRTPLVSPALDEASIPSTDTAVVATTGSQSSQPQKVLFASGGLTNGEQALAALNAGANIAMLYTGLVYGGSGTITRMKEEMRQAKKNV
ncbi:Dihydroorotate dehydrogenase (quinone), mitochondrial [Myotisia sp. PD_48]|nr:Dihydroorotate dehydrogenase (quinone), mitochondrial [Myotisia sp. PD_48]